MKLKVMLVVCVLCFSFIATSCSVKDIAKGLVSNDGIESTKDIVSNDENESNKEKKESPDENSKDNNVIMGTGEEWPDWIPNSIPEYNYGDVYKAQKEDEGGTIILMNINMKKSPFESYCEDLEDKGWVLDYEGQTNQSKNVGYINDNRYLMYVFPDDGSMANIMFFNDAEQYLDEGVNGAENKNEGEKDNADKENADKDTMSVEEDGVNVTVGNESIPEEYPSDLCPIYDPSDILGTQSMGDNETTICTIMLLTKDESDDIVDFYKDYDVQEIMGPDLMMIESEDGKTTISIMINPAEEEDVAKGYKNMINITATIGK